MKFSKYSTRVINVKLDNGNEHYIVQHNIIPFFPYFFWYNLKEYDTRDVEDAYNSAEYLFKWLNKSKPKKQKEIVLQYK